MKVLVTGGTGTVGSQVVEGLLARGVEVHVLSRSGRGVPAGAHAIVGDLDQPVTVRTAFADVDGVFLLNAVTTTEAHSGLMAVNGARAAQVKRIVYLSVQDAEKAAHLPHYGAKIPVEMAIKASGIAFTILRPNNFFQNDGWAAEAVRKYGVFTQPIGGVGLSRVDIRDIAEVAVRALVDDAARDETIELVGPDVITGESAAATWSQVLGRAVRYGGDDLDSWEKRSLSHLPPSLAFDVRLMYEFFQSSGLRARQESVTRLTEVLGREPRSYSDFVRETVATWKTDAPA